MLKNHKKESPKALFIDRKYAPHGGGTAEMFKHRFSLFPTGNIIVLSAPQSNAQAFDSSVGYTIVRKAVWQWGPQGLWWISQALSQIVHGVLISLKHTIAYYEAARPLPEGFAARVLSMIFRKPCVVNYHGEDINVLAKYRLEKVVLRQLIASASLNLANSSYTRNLLLQYGDDPQKCTVVEPGVCPYSRDELDTEKIASLRAKFGGDPIVLTLSRLQERKGQDTLIKALPKVIIKHPGLKCIIAGSDDFAECRGYGDYLKGLAKELDVEHHLYFSNGFVSSEQKPYYYAAADLFVMPNRELSSGDVEGFGIVFLEAASLGVPVIGGNSGGVIDAVCHETNGLLVDSASIDVVADAILQLLESKPRAQQMGEHGIVFARSLSYTRVFEKYAAAVSALCCDRDMTLVRST